MVVDLRNSRTDGTVKAIQMTATRAHCPNWIFGVG
jgi:hypothetical protein